MYLSNDGEKDLRFDNNGKCPIAVPGFGLPVPVELPSDKRFAHGFGEWAQSRLTAREIAMLRLMNSITDRPQWHLNIRIPDVIAAWSSEARDHNLISPAAWDWCLAELRDKAALYETTNIIHALDSASRICKSDTRINCELLTSLTGEAKGLPHLVDPDMFPLIYGETRVLSDGGRVGCMNAADYSDCGNTSAPQIWPCPKAAAVRCDGSTRSTMGVRGRGRGRGRGTLRGGASRCSRCKRADYETPRAPEKSWVPRGDRFSPHYQWLPSEVSFANDSTKGTSRIQLRSYVNNMHPRRCAEAYKAIEKCIEASILPWNEVLVRRDRGRTPERIRTYGVQWNLTAPRQSILGDMEVSKSKTQDIVFQDAKQRTRDLNEQPEDPLAPLNSHWSTTVESNPDKAAKLVSPEAFNLRYQHPEPGISFTYQDWKSGRNTYPIVDPPRKYMVAKEDHEFYTVDLERSFAVEGLQVVVEVGGIDLTPENPSRPATNWELSGLLNDHIVATTVIYFSSENISPGSMSFRVEADLDPGEHVWGCDAKSNPYHPLTPLAGIYGCESHRTLARIEDGDTLGDRALQVLGSVSTPDGRLLAFPNVMQHRTEAISLLDPSRSGHRRFLKLHLVDPHYRICSTRNVPPQGYHWWYEAGLGRMDWEGRDMPAELVMAIESFVGNSGFPIDFEEAQRLRDEVHNERRKKFERVQDEVGRYSFLGCCAWGRETDYQL